MKRIPVKSTKQNYEILVGSRILSKAAQDLKAVLGSASKVLVVTQKNIPTAHLKQLKQSVKKAGLKAFIYYIPNGEKAKSEKQFFAMIHKMLSLGFERGDAMIGLGGGVVGDLTGFVAASYLRGIKYVNVPTTLLAQVDSSVGGKTAINTSEGKNLVGAFNPPALVISDVSTLETLPVKELKAALAEVVKYGVIRDAALFKFLEQNVNKILKHDSKSFEHIVATSAGIKAQVVSRDEFELKGERMILNYGHTFGHGIEGALGYKKLVHGEAVGIGMLMAAQFAFELKLCSESVYSRQVELIRRFGLKSSTKGLAISAEQIFDVMQHDKKKKGGKLRYILPTRIGKVEAVSGVSKAHVLKVIQKYT